MKFLLIFLHPDNGFEGVEAIEPHSLGQAVELAVELLEKQQGDNASEIISGTDDFGSVVDALDSDGSIIYSVRVEELDL